MNTKIVAVIVLAILIVVGLYAVFTSFNPSTSSTSTTSRSSSSLTSSSSSSSQSTSSSSSSSVSSSTSFSSSSSSSSSSVAAAFTLQVGAQLSNGTAVSGMNVQVSSGGTAVNSSTLPASFTLTGGKTYNVTVSNGNGYFFDHWKSGQSTKTIAVQLTNNTSLVAEYKLPGLQTITVLGRDVQGRTVAGTNASFYRNGVYNGSNIIPSNFTAKYGDKVGIEAFGAGTLFFQYWNNNKSLSSPWENFTVTGNTSVSAYFLPTALPVTSPGRGNFTITVYSHTPDGGELVGAYFQIRLNGYWNRTINGFTPASIQVPANETQELVMYHCALFPPCDQRFFIYRHYNDSANTFTRWIYITEPAGAKIEMNSFYDIMPAVDTVHLTVDGLNYSNFARLYNCTCGAPITIYQNGKEFAASLTPYSFFLWKGQNYTVNLGTMPGNYTFVHWDNGVSSTNRTVVPGMTPPPIYTDPNDTKYLIDQEVYGLFQKNGMNPSSATMAENLLATITSAVMGGMWVAVVAPSVRVRFTRRT